MSNRTSSGIPINLGKVLARYGVQRQQKRAAILGDGRGNISVVSNADNNGTDGYGYYWIQLALGNDNAGNTQYSEGQKARVEEFLNFEERQGLPLRVFQSDKNGEWVIHSVDTGKLIAASINPLSYNFFRIINSLFARMLHDGTIFVPNQPGSNGTKFTIESYVSLWDGDRQFYEHGRGLSANLDLAAYIPSAGDECLVLVAYLAYEKSYQVIAGATRSISATAFNLSYLNAMAEQLTDYAEVKGCLRLQNDQTTVTVEDFIIDLRQWFASPKPRGFPSVITAPVTVIADYQQIAEGDIHLSANLKLDGSLTIR